MPVPGLPVEAACIADGRISADTRLFVWTRDAGRCRNCGSNRELHFDHVIPRSLGGAGTADNVELLCAECNLKKGARLFVPRTNARTAMIAG